MYVKYNSHSLCGGTKWQQDGALAPATINSSNNSTEIATFNTKIAFLNLHIELQTNTHTGDAACTVDTISSVAMVTGTVAFTWTSRPTPGINAAATVVLQVQ